MADIGDKKDAHNNNSDDADANNQEIDDDLMISLETNDNKVFKTTLKIARSSTMIDTMIKDLGLSADKLCDEPLKLPNVQSDVMVKVLEYAEHHKGVEDPLVNEENKLSEFDKSFWNELENAEPEKKKLYDVISAANYLDMKYLLDSGCQYIADLMKGKKPDQIREMFGIENDFEPEEYAKIVEETKWAFE
jgi:hypothetical protein